MSQVRVVRHSIPRTEGGHLSAILHLPDRPRGGLILSHCFTCSKDYKILVHLSRRVSSAGFAALRLDHSGLGESDGAFEDTTLSGYSRDLADAIAWMRQQEIGSIVLLGHSMGGSASLLTAAGRADIQGVVLLATTSRTANLYRLLPQLDPANRKGTGPIEVAIGGRSFAIHSRFLEDLERHSLTDSVSRLGCPLLILHGTDDGSVSIEHARILLEAAHAPKKFYAIPGAGHLLSNPQDAERIASVLIPWLENDVPEPAQSMR